MSLENVFLRGDIYQQFFKRKEKISDNSQTSMKK